MTNLNEFNQEIGIQLPNWTRARLPEKTKLSGTFVNLEPLDIGRDTKKLFHLFQNEPMGWTYLPYGPFSNLEDFLTWLTSISSTNDPFFYTILDQDNCPLGLASYVNIRPANGVIEVGHVHFSNKLKKTPTATEAMYLMMKHAFQTLGYRRYEWKCDSLNQASRNAAERLGFN